MRNIGIPFTYTKAYGVQSEISHVTITRVAGQEVDYHRNVNSYHRDMMFKINSLCREQKRLKEYRRKLLKIKWKSSELKKEKEAAAAKAIKEQEEDEPMDVAEPSSEDKSNELEPVLEEPKDEIETSVQDLNSAKSVELQTKIEPSEAGKNKDNNEVVIVGVVEKTGSDQIETLITENLENETGSHSHRRTSCESVILRSTPTVIPPIVSHRDTDGTPERKTSLSHVKTNKGPGSKSEGRGPLREISTNLIKLQYNSNHKLLCRLVDAMAHRQNDKDVLSKKQKTVGPERAFKPPKPSSDHDRDKRRSIENHDPHVDSLPCLCKNGFEKHKNRLVPGCPRHSSRSSFDASQVNRCDMTGKRVLPPISERGETNSVRHDINRYLRKVSPVDPLLKRLSQYEKVNKVTWETAFSSLKNLKCL